MWRAKRRINERRRILVSYCDFIKSSVVKTCLSCRQRKKPVAIGEEDGQIRTADKDSCMYFSIASFSGLVRLYNFLTGSSAPESKSVAQAYGL